MITFGIFKYNLLLFGIFFISSVNSQGLKEIKKKADKAIKREQFAEAVPLLKKLVASDSTDSEVIFNLAMALHRTKDFHECIKYSTQGILVDSTYAAHYFRRGVCSAGLGDYQSAILDYTKAIKLDKKSFSYFNRAIARWKSGDINGGIADFTASLELEPKDEFAFCYRAMCYNEIGDTLRATADFNKVIELKPRDVDIYFELANFKFQSHSYTEAKAYYQRCIQMSQSYILGYLSLSEVALILRDYTEASKHASNAIKYTSDKDEQAIGLILNCISKKLMNIDTSSDEATLNNILANFKTEIWRFDVLQNELAKQNISEEKGLYFIKLINSYNKSKLRN
jgi:tetratricopeptide (TPR) repeat protein